ncbi:hypothetical protein GCM10011494_15740 [Novosphingobium endophyticum]|uniref:Pyridoxamine 5'-phosphate oxidase putative domain-containing protein n=1 Tax=Novosphingobium endophyticum TaxID=1955250 RepID=A0A916TSR9_9SPHN|nr:hypothetical protein [Novosphingobium endophyticum]GGB98126.1 hypothetical protein GCM10011494_15740 [Novosphingobium endophyticum]
MAQIQTVSRLREIIADYGPRGAAKIRDRICDQGRAFIDRCPFLVLGTIGPAGIELSPKGGEPGFVRQVDDRTLLLPNMRGTTLRSASRTFSLTPG